MNSVLLSPFTESQPACSHPRDLVECISAYRSFKRQTSFLWWYNQLPQTKQLESNTHLVSHSSVCQCPQHGLTGFSAQDIISLKSSCWLDWVLVWSLWGKILLQAHSVFLCVCVWKCRVLTIGWPGKSPSSFLSLALFSFLWLWDGVPDSSWASGATLSSTQEATSLSCHMVSSSPNQAQCLKPLSCFKSFWCSLLPAFYIFIYLFGCARSLL